MTKAGSARARWLLVETATASGSRPSHSSPVRWDPLRHVEG
ncbi:MAG: hypothetical protein ABR543_11100 [Gemmatimonadaceae bacterium]